MAAAMNSAQQLNPFAAVLDHIKHLTPTLNLHASALGVLVVAQTRKDALCVKKPVVGG